MADVDDGWIVLDGVRKSDRLMQSVIGAAGVDLLTVVPVLVASEVSTAVASAHPVEVNLQSQELSYGRLVLPFADLTRGILGVNGYGRFRVLDLHFGDPARLMLVAPLSEGDTRPLDTSTRILLGRVLEGSSIAMPVDRYDSTGKFSRYNFPENVTREQAVELVLNPPMPGDKLPIPE